jgi:hypothetical protein
MMTLTSHESDGHPYIDLFLELYRRRGLDLYIHLCHDGHLDDRLYGLYRLDFDRDRCLVRCLQKLVLIARRTEVR